MKKILAVLFVGVFALAIVGCGDDDGEPTDNVGACKAWVDKMNKEKCGTLDMTLFTKNIPCDSYTNLACDISDYFNCLTTGYQCKDVAGIKTIDVSGWTACASKAACK